MNRSEWSAPVSGWGVRFRALRLALDWARLLFARFVTGAQWRRVEEWCEDGEVELMIRRTGEVIVLRALRARRGEAVLSGHGVRVVVREERAYRRPTTRPADPATALVEAMRVQDEQAAFASERERQPYGVEVDVQGAALSLSLDGLDVVEDVRDAIEELLFRHCGSTFEARRAVLAQSTFLGRFDLACDVAVSGTRADEWIESILFRRGHLDRAFNDWKTRARSEGTERMVEREKHRPSDSINARDESREPEHARTVGSARLGRTLYIGSAPSFARVYERDKHTGDGHWDVLRHTLAVDGGWDERSRVVRFELELQRAWMRDQEISRGEEKRRLHLLPIDEAFDALPVIASAVVQRYEHRPGGEASAWWCEIRRAFDRFTAKLTANRPCTWERLRSVKRAATIERMKDRGARAIVTLQEMLGVSKHAAVTLLLERVDDPAERGNFDRLRERVRREYRPVEPVPDDAIETAA